MSRFSNLIFNMTSESPPDFSRRLLDSRAFGFTPRAHWSKIGLHKRELPKCFGVGSYDWTNPQGGCGGAEFIFGDHPGLRRWVLDSPGIRRRVFLNKRIAGKSEKSSSSPSLFEQSDIGGYSSLFEQPDNGEVGEITICVCCIRRLS